MQKIDSIVAVAGWEERFVLGFRKTLEEHAPSNVMVIAFEEYLDVTAENRSQVKQLSEAANAVYTELRVRREAPASVWEEVTSVLSSEEWSKKSVLVDITTMPREVIWLFFGGLEDAGSTISYVYYRPGEYASEWVTRDTERPRLVYQNSGVSEFGRDTCLVVLSGFDVDRVAQMIQFFEPAAILIGLQTGTQFENQRKNIERHRLQLAGFKQIKYFDIDAYSSDHGFASIENVTTEEREKYNIVAASLGPKLSAIALYQLHGKYPTLALAYAPSRQFNAGYSKGIGEPVIGHLAPTVTRNL